MVMVIMQVFVSFVRIVMEIANWIGKQIRAFQNVSSKSTIRLKEASGKFPLRFHL